MRCHDILGITEKADDTEILNAYYKKKNSIRGIVGIGSSAYEMRLHEIDKAKEECLDWRQKSFTSRTSARLIEMSTSAFSPNRLNEVCIGPCSFCDLCCGLAWSSRNDSCCVDCCGISTAGLSPAVFCDVGIYIVSAFGFIVALFKGKEERDRWREKIEREKRAALVATLQSKLAQEEEQLKELDSKCRDLHEKKALLCKYSMFFSALITDTNMGSSIGLLPIDKLIQNIDSQIQNLENQIAKEKKESRNIESQIRENSLL